jgi:hypothetical protein
LYKSIVEIEARKLIVPVSPVPRTPNFNPDVQGKTASYFNDMPKLTDEQVDFLDHTYRRRLRALQAVDEMVGEYAFISCYIL